MFVFQWGECWFERQRAPSNDVCLFTSAGYPTCALCDQVAWQHRGQQHHFARARRDPLGTNPIPLAD